MLCTLIMKVFELSRNWISQLTLEMAGIFLVERTSLSVLIKNLGMITAWNLLADRYEIILYFKFDNFYWQQFQKHLSFYS